jgi:hypothetical protein
MVTRWVTSEAEMDAENWQELAKKMKVALGKKKLSEAMYKMKVLNHLGANGWELVGFEPQDNNPNLSQWLFKRKIDK